MRNAITEAERPTNTSSKTLKRSITGMIIIIIMTGFVLTIVIWLADNANNTPEILAQQAWEKDHQAFEHSLAKKLLIEHQVQLDNTVQPYQVNKRRSNSVTEPAPGTPGEENTFTTVTNRITYQLSPPGTGSLSINHVCRFLSSTPRITRWEMSQRTLLDQYLDLSSLVIERAPAARPLRIESGTNKSQMQPRPGG